MPQGEASAISHTLPFLTHFTEHWCYWVTQASVTHGSGMTTEMFCWGWLHLRFPYQCSYLCIYIELRVHYNLKAHFFLPGLEKMTEKESAHPTTQQLNELTTSATVNGDLVGPVSPTSLVAPAAIGETIPQDVSDTTSSIPKGTSIQPPTEDHNLPAVDELKISDKVM